MTSDSGTSIAESNSNSGTETSESNSDCRETSISSSKQQLKASSKSAVKNSNSDSTNELTEKAMDLASRQKLCLVVEVLESLLSCPEYDLPTQSTTNQRIAHSLSRGRKTKG